MTLFRTAEARPCEIAGALRRTCNPHEPGIGQCNENAQARDDGHYALLPSNGRLARWTASRGRPWLPVSVILMVMWVVVIAAVAQNQTGKTQVQSGLTPLPYWAYAGDPSPAEAKPVDDTPQHVQGARHVNGETMKSQSADSGDLVRAGEDDARVFVTAPEAAITGFNLSGNADLAVPQCR